MEGFDLGRYGRPASAVPAAQRACDEGLAWLYGYNHEAAVARFEAAVAADPGCGFALWGIAYAVGPNYNRPWAVFSADDRRDALRRAAQALDAAAGLALGPVESALVSALRLRYPEDPATDDIAPWADAYADAMTGIRDRFPDDLDIAALTAEALMMRTPWALWDLGSGAPAAGASTERARAILERAFAGLPGAWTHPGLLHLYIHLMEMSPWPELALRHGDALIGLVPDSGHLAHMGTHIDLLTGDYAACVARNVQAAAIDRRYHAVAGGENFYTLYRLHNLHFACYGALFLGQKGVALWAAQALAAELPEAVVRVYPELFESFLGTLPHVHIRFGDWQAALDTPLPEDRTLYAYTRATGLYARTVALANLGRPAEAEASLAALRAEAAAIPEERMLFNNSARDVLRVGEAMAAGEVAFKAGRIAEGLDCLRLAVACDDALLYEEPWAWPIPARHALGALLCDAGAWDEAEAVYRADLGLDPHLPRPCQHPQNVWALAGLDACLARRGERVERPHIAAQLARAQARCDRPVRASCFCQSGARGA